MPVQFLETNITEIDRLKVKEFTELVSKEDLRMVQFNCMEIVQTEMVVAVEQVNKMQQVVAVEDMLILVIMEDQQSGHTGGSGGNVVGIADLSKLIFGGAGGEGGADEDGHFTRERAEMEEELFSFQLSSVINSGIISSDGEDAGNGTNNNPNGSIW